MKAFNFFKIDLIRCKMQLLFGVAIMVVFSLLFAFESKMLGAATGYLFFVAVMYAGQPFNMDSQSEAGFMDMIPGTGKERLLGRYLYGITCLLVASLLGLALLALYYVRVGSLSENTPYYVQLFVGVAVFVTSLQYIGMYIAGKGKSQQFITFIQMGPTVIVFFIMFLIEKIDSVFHFISDNWITNNKAVLSSGVLVIGFLMMALSFVICNRISEKRDYE